MDTLPITMSSKTAQSSDLNTSKTNMSLDDAVTFATELIKPLADVNKHIQDNISMVKEKQNEIERIDPDSADLPKVLTTTRTTLAAKRLDPKTVCGSWKCTLATKGPTGKMVAIYERICHVDCGINGVPTGCKHQEQLKSCLVMFGPLDNRKCQQCSCSWEEHMHITYETSAVEEKVEDVNIKELFKTSDDKSQVVKVFRESLQGKINILEGEQKAVTQVSAQLETFLEQNNKSAGTSDITAGYMDHLIDVQQNLVTLGNNRDLLESMMTTRTSYHQEVNALKQATKTGTTDQVVITPENIFESVEKLCSLPETGDQIRKTIDAVTSAGISGRIDSVVVSFSGLNLVSTQTDSLKPFPANNELKLPTTVIKTQ